MVGCVLGVYLLPDVDFAVVGPSFRLVGGHEPEGGEIAAVGMGEDAGFDLSILEVEQSG